MGEMDHRLAAFLVGVFVIGLGTGMIAFGLLVVATKPKAPDAPADPQYWIKATCVQPRYQQLERCQALRIEDPTHDR